MGISITDGIGSCGDNGASWASYSAGADPVTLPVSTFVGNLIIGDGATDNYNAGVATGSDSIVMGTGASIRGNGANQIAIGTNANTGNFKAIAIGAEATTGSGDWAVAIGPNSQSQSYGTAVGAITTATSSGVAIGRAANSASDSVIAIGYSATASSTETIAIGKLSSASNLYANAIGSSAVASGQEALSIGSYSTANSSYAIALGNSAKATNARSTVLGSYAQTGWIGQTKLGCPFYPVSNIYDAYKDGYSVTSLGISTTNATPATITLVSEASNTTYAISFEVDVVVQDLDTTEVWQQKLSGLAQKTAAATLALVGAVDSTVAKTTGGLTISAAIGVSAGNLQLTVTGEAAKNLRWVTTTRVTTSNYS